LSGNVAAMDTKQVLARGDKRLMVLLGVEDLIVVETAGTLLIAYCARTQNVRRVIDELTCRGMTTSSESHGSQGQVGP
jgi:hypothetical protein